MCLSILSGCAPQPAATAAPQAAAPAAAATTAAPAVAPTTAPAVAPTAAAAATKPAATGAITVTDAAGRKVTLAKSPQRIVVVGQGAFMVLHTLFMFPEAKKLVVAHEQRQANNSVFLKLIDPDFASKGVIQMDAGPEQIVTFKPDLAIIKSTADVKLAAGLEQIGVPVVYVGLETPEMIYQDVANLGQILGNEKRAKEITSFYQTRVNNLKEKTAGIDEKSKPTVLTMDYKDKNGQVAVSVAPEGWMQTIQVKLAGGNPVWTEAAKTGSNWITVNLEQVTKWNPDKIFVIYFLSDPAEVLAKLKADPQWKGLKAVQNNQIYAYAFDLFSWDTPDTRWILGTTWMAKNLYPDRFKDIDLNQEVTAFFTELYGMDKASIEKNILPKLKTDVR
jgi:iron complex transport system substrate-binding protein